MDLMKLIDPKDLIDFSQNFSVTRNYLGDSLFPDQKTEHLKAEFLRLTDGLCLHLKLSSFQQVPFLRELLLPM